MVTSAIRAPFDVVWQPGSDKSDFPTDQRSAVLGLMVVLRGAW